MTAADRKEWRLSESSKLGLLGHDVYEIGSFRRAASFVIKADAEEAVADHNARLAHEHQKDALRMLASDIVAMARHCDHGVWFVLSKTEAEGTAFAAIEAFLKGGDATSTNASTDQKPKSVERVCSSAPEPQTLGGASAGREAQSHRRYGTLYCPIPVRPEPAAVERALRDLLNWATTQVSSLTCHGQDCIRAARAALSRMPAGLQDDELPPNAAHLIVSADEMAGTLEDALRDIDASWRDDAENVLDAYKAMRIAAPPRDETGGRG